MSDPKINIVEMMDALVSFTSKESCVPANVQRRCAEVVTVLAEITGEAVELRETAKTDIETITRLKADMRQAIDTIHGLARDRLAMPTTPDDTLVVLGETELWTRVGDCVISCVPKILTLGVPSIFVTGEWLWPDGKRFARNVCVDCCYGSEANLLEAEKS
jgi:hypothetical protein